MNYGNTQRDYARVIERDTTLWLTYRIANHPRFQAALEDLKDRIPTDAGFGRRFDPERKAWVIGTGYWNHLEDWTRRWFNAHQVTWIEEEPEPPKVPARLDRAWTTLYLVPGAPLVVIQAAYRALAHMNHPDHGGSETTMKEINAAYELLKEVAK